MAEPVEKIRAKAMAPVGESLHVHDTLQKVKVFLRDLARDGEAHMDPVRLYRGVCKALGEKPVKIII